MSLYNMLFGHNPLAGVALAALNLTPDNIPRFRDAYYDAEEDLLVVYTRTGGGNREYYDAPGSYYGEDKTGPFNSDLEAHPAYLRDEDDDFDSTYAYFYFNVPESFRPIFNTFRELGAGKDLNPTDKFAKMIEDLQAGVETEDTKRALDVGKSIAAQISEQISHVVSKDNS